MGMSSIEIHNLLSFDNLYINKFEDINCIVGRNNAGKSNLLKLVKYFYSKLNGERELAPNLNNKYSSKGHITITYDISKVLNIIYSKNVYKSHKNMKESYRYLKHLFTLLKTGNLLNKNKSIKLTLIINSDDSTQWSINNYDLHRQLFRLFPFFYIDTRHIDLYDWSEIWDLASRLKSFKTNSIEQEDIKDFFDKKLSTKNEREYGKYIENIETLINTHTSSTSRYTYKEKVLNYIKVGIQGHNFLFKGENIDIQSDGTNSSNYIQIYLAFIIALTRRDYISPTVYIDEPEIGLHPKKNEELIYNLYEQYISLKKLDDKKKLGHYATPYPNIFFSTHSPNIVKYIIKLFNKNQQILHFSKDKNNNTLVNKLNSQYNDLRYLNIFSDNEARLYFSDFILFVEGETELEIFGNKKLNEKFTQLKYIDVYQTSSNVILKYANPSYSNSSIPYKILYDIDKILKSNTKKFTFFNDNVDINEIRKKYKKSFFSYKKNSQYQKYKQFEKEVYLKTNTLYHAENNLHVTSFNYSEFIKEINHFFNDENYIFAKTTIEETLINNSSLSLFLDWILSEYNKIESIGTSSSIAIRKFENRYNSHRELVSTYRKLFFTKVNYNINDLKDDEKKFVKKIKERYGKLIIKKFNHLFSEKDKVVALIIIFNGKSNTLVSRENIVKNVNIEFQNNIEQIENLLIVINDIFEKQKGKKSIVGKTSGWTTKFINYSIERIEEEIIIEIKKDGLLKKGNDNTKKKKELFEKKFKYLFEELYAIIQQTKF